MNSVITPSDCHNALKSWRSPRKLSSCHIADQILAPDQLLQSLVDDKRVTRIADRAKVVQTFLCNALDQVAQMDVGRILPYRSVESLVIYQRFVLDVTLEEIKRVFSISSATLFRYQQKELALLASTIEDMVSVELAKTTGHLTQKQFHPPPRPEVVIGREREFESIRSALLFEKVRPAVVVVGAPGMGKTTLAFALANDEKILERFSDGVLWCSVGQWGQPKVQLLEWADRLNASWAKHASLPQQQLHDVVASLTQNKKLLLIIDDVWNVEDIAALQIGGDKCAHLITTRQPAVAWRISNASVLTLDDLQTQDAISLLKWHLSTGLSDVDKNHISHGDAKLLISTIGTCPLSVSIVGQNLRRFIISRESWRFEAYLHRAIDNPRARVLTGRVDSQGHEDSISQRIQQTLETLTSEDQATFATLSIFPHKPDYFTVDEACAIANCSIENLERLTDAGLIQTFNHRHLVIHQAIAEFAAELPQDIGCYARMAIYFSEVIKTIDGVELASRMTLFIAALVFAEKSRCFDAFCILANSLFSVMEASGQFALALQVLTNAEDMSRGKSHHAVTLANLARAQLLSQQFLNARDTAHKAISLIGEAGDVNVRANCYYTLADVEWNLGNAASSTEFAEKALTLLTAIDHPHTISLVGTLPSRLFTERLQQRSIKQWLSWLGKAVSSPHMSEQSCLMSSGQAFLNFQMGRGMRADEQLEESLCIANANDFKLARLTGMAFRAWIHHHLSFYASSDEFAHEVISTDHVMIPDVVVMAHSILSLNAMARGEFGTAEAFAKSIQPFSSQRSARLLSLVVDVTLIRVQITVGQLKEARANTELLLHSATASRLKEITGIAHALIGLIETRECRFGEADKHFLRSRSWLAEQITGPWFTLFYRICRGEYLLASEQYETARNEYMKVLSIGERVQCPEYQAKALFGLARVASRQNDISRANTLAIRSAQVFDNIGHINAQHVQEWLSVSNPNTAIHSLLVV